MLVYLAIAKRNNPTWVLWENVPGVLSSNRGRDFGTFLGGLAELGYGFAYRVLDAQFFGVPQRRRRVFVVGYLGDWRPPAAVLFESTSLRGYPPPIREAGARVASTLTRGADSNGENGYSGRRQEDDINIVTQSLTRALGSGGPDDNRAQAGFYVPEIVGQAMSAKWAKGTAGPAGDEHHNLVTGTLAASGAGSDRPAGQGNEADFCIPDGLAVRRLTPRECERLQGFPDDYTAITYRGKPAKDSPRYRALGNSMAVPVMRWIGGRIKKVTSEMVMI